MAANTGGGVAGGACIVTEGTNKGKQGTYTIDDEGNVWCEGSWGGTECFARCKDGVVDVAVLEYEDADGESVYETDGLYEIPGSGIYRVRAQLEAKSGKTRYVAAVPMPVLSLTGPRKADSKVVRALAEAIASHMDNDVIKQRRAP